MSQNHRKSSFCFSNQPLPRRRREGRSVFTWSNSRPATIIPENYQTTVQIDNNAVTHHYLWMPNQQDKLLADTTPTEVLWSLTDHLGTIRDVLGATTTHLIYDAFGNLVSGTNPLLFGYTGKAFDSATNLQNNINRWYDATVGRWLSTDPIGFEGNDTNLYRYVKNRANICFDFSGTQASISHKFEGNWTDNDKKKILDALDVLAVRLLTIQKKLDEFFPMIADNEKYSCECRRAIIEEFAKFRTVLQYSLKVALGDYPMKFHQQVLYKNPVFINFFTGDTSVEGKHTPGNIWLNLAPMEDWKNNPDLPRLLFHEISHEFGTEDNGSLLFDDAHFIENYAQKIITPNFSLHLDRVAQSLPECQEV